MSDRLNVMNALYCLLGLLKDEQEYEELFFTSKRKEDMGGELGECYASMGGLISTEVKFMKVVVICKLKELHFMMKQFRPTALLFKTYAKVRESKGKELEGDAGFLLEYCKTLLELGMHDEARGVYEKAHYMTLNGTLNEKSAVIASAWDKANSS